MMNPAAQPAMMNGKRLELSVGASTHLKIDVVPTLSVVFPAGQLKHFDVPGIS